MFGHVKGAFTGAVGNPRRRHRAGQRRHAVPRRNLRDGFVAAGQVAARAAIGRIHQGRRQRGRARRFALCLRHQPRPLGRGAGRPLPRRPVLPPARRALRDAAVARARRATCCCWRATSWRSTARRRGSPSADFDAAAIESLTRYAWPGNIRELQNLLRNVVLFNEGTMVTAAMLSRLDAAPPPRARTRRPPGRYPPTNRAAFRPPRSGRSGRSKRRRSRRRSKPATATSRAPPHCSKSTPRQSTAAKPNGKRNGWRRPPRFCGL